METQRKVGTFFLRELNTLNVYDAVGIENCKMPF